MARPLLFIFFLLPSLSHSVSSPSSTDAPKWLNTFSQYLVDKFNEQSRFELINQEISSLRGSLRLKSESAAHSLQSAHRAISSLLEKRKRALQRLARSAEESIREYSGASEAIVDNATWCNFAPIINVTDVHFPTQSTEGTKESGVHINIESYTCDSGVVRDFTWTGTQSIDDAFKENEREDASIPNQFIGTYTSLTRMYPRRKWEIEPEKITADLFDPKFRPWFVNAEAPPKDIVFLLDYSGSTKGPTMHLSRITLLYILSTLNPNDYIAGVWFNKGFAPVLNCTNTTFIPATTRNKMILYTESKKEETEKADLGPPLKYSIEMLRNHSSVLFGDARSGSHKLIILLTDGIDEWPHSIIQDTLIDSTGEKIRVFGMAMGFATGPLPLLDHLACTTNATTSVVDSISDVKAQSRSYLDHLSDVHSLTLQSIPIEDRPISWSTVYMDNQAAGPVVTLSTPLPVPNDHRYWFNNSEERRLNRMGGVAGVDINIKELTAHLPQGDGLRSFIVDNNGMVVYHKDHKLPKTEVHAVRRSACYESSHVKKKSGHALRVQYGHSDERVYRLVGLLDSIPTIDMYELEGKSKIVQNLRKYIMDGKCDGKTKIMDKNTSETDYYLCKSFPSTPLTLIIFSSHNTASYDYTGPPIPSSQLTTSNPMVQYLMAKRSACNWAIDRVHDDTRSLIGLEKVRYSQWMNHPECIDNPSERFSRAMAGIIKKWSDSWPESPTGTCVDSGILAGIPFDVSYYLNSFVYTRGQVAAFYPSCQDSEESMKELTEKMEKERLWKKYGSEIQFSVRKDHVIIYKPILDDNNNRLAIVGMQWRLDHLTERFTNWTRTNNYTGDPCGTHTCLLLSRSAYVIASNRGQFHPSHAPLTQFDPQTFEELKKLKEIHVEETTDYQTECTATMRTMWASPSSQAFSPLRSLFYALSQLLSFILSINFSMLFSVFISPIESQPQIIKNGTCHFQEIVPAERCAYIHYQYTVTKNDHKQFDMKGACTRYGRLHNVKNTRLALMVVQNACKNEKDTKDQEKEIPYHPIRIYGCDTIANYPRKRPNYTFTLSSPGELNLTADKCQRSSNSPMNSNAFIIVISSFLLRSFN